LVSGMIGVKDNGTGGGCQACCKLKKAIEGWPRSHFKGIGILH
jgi:hypothetical protein